MHVASWVVLGLATAAAAAFPMGSDPAAFVSAPSRTGRERKKVGKGGQIEFGGPGLAQKRRYLDPLAGGSIGKRQYFDPLNGLALGKRYGNGKFYSPEFLRRLTLPLPPRRPQTPPSGRSLCMIARRTVNCSAQLDRMSTSNFPDFYLGPLLRF